MAKFVGRQATVSVGASGLSRLTPYGIPFASGSIVRSYEAFEALSCDECGCSLTRSRMWYVDMQRVASGGSWCMNCAGFIVSENRFKTLEDYIRESLPSGLKDMPSLVLADYLEDHGASAAEWIRNHTSGG